MRCVTMFQTADGRCFDTEKEARRHADALLGAAITKLAHAAVRIDKYVDMMDFIEANIPEFAALAALKADTNLSSDDSY